MTIFDIKSPPPGFIDDPYPTYARLRREAPVLAQPDGSFVVSSYQALDAIYRDNQTFSSDKKAVFGPKFGSSPLFEHHTTSLVFNDHLAFAGGPHTCVGLSLARLEARIALRRFLERYPNFEIVTRKYSPRMRFRGFATLIAKLAV